MQQSKHSYEVMPFYFDYSKHPVILGGDQLTGTPTMVNPSTDLTFPTQATIVTGPLTVVVNGVPVVLPGPTVVQKIGGGKNGVSYGVNSQCPTTGSQNIGVGGTLVIADF